MKVCYHANNTLRSDVCIDTAQYPRDEYLVRPRAVGTRAYGPRADSTRSYQIFIPRAQCCIYANILVQGAVCC